jgi:dienelactone hydrolase
MLICLLKGVFMLKKFKKINLLLLGFFSLLLITNCQNVNTQKNIKQSIKKQPAKTEKKLSYSETLIKGINNVSIISGDKLQGYQDIISNKKPKKITIDGKLYLPDNCKKDKLPAVIIQHGSGSPKAPFYSKTAKALNSKGIIALVPDSFKTRNISATGKNQGQLSKATRLYDTFSAFRFLRTLDCVDPNRVGVTGYSFGGIISIDSVETKLATKLGDGFIYKASLPVYPSCQNTFKNTQATKTKVHILAGSLDDYTPASYCIESVKSKKTKGWDINITVLDGAHHGFNNSSPPKKNPNSWTFGDCGKLYTDDAGFEFSPKYNVSTKDGWRKFVRTMAKNCGRKGVTVGGSPDLAKKTIDFTVNFFAKNL